LPQIGCCQIWDESPLTKNLFTKGLRKNEFAAAN